MTGAPGESTVVYKYPSCDIHIYLHQQSGVEAHYDGKTVGGTWAYMCDDCLKQHGVGLGLGRGQQLIVRQPTIRLTHYLDVLAIEHQKLFGETRDLPNARDLLAGTAAMPTRPTPLQRTPAGAGAHGCIFCGCL